MVTEHNSKKIALGGSWRLLGAILKPLWEVLGFLGVVWRTLGVVLWWCWELLRRSWGGLGSSWGGLRASWGGPVEVCCCSLIFDRFLVRFWIDLGAQKAPKMDPKRSPKQTKIEAKNQHEK